MASVQEHYASHLAPVYLWMAGGFERAIELGKADLDGLPIDLSSCRTAIDLGAGFGMHAVPLARRGCGVTAIDTSTALLDELLERSAGLPIRTVEADLLTVGDHASEPASLVLCMGDTLTHLSHVDDVGRLCTTVSRCLAPGGHFVLTFRNYERPPQGTARFIPVRSDGDRILTCFLEEDDSRVLVHDILHERRDSGWEMRVSAYPKLRLAPSWVAECLQRAGLSAVVSPGPRGMACVIGSK